MDECGGLSELLSGAGGMLDGLRFREKELEESLALVRERIAAAQAVLDAVKRWQALPAETAESTGYVPRAMMSVPLLHDERALGVLNVLDRSQEIEFSLGQMELLGLFANQAAIALDLLQRARHARAVLTQSGSDAGAVARIAAALEDLDEEQREPVLRLLTALDDVLRADVSF